MIWIGPESDHWLPTDDSTDVTLACEQPVADVDAGKCVVDSLVQIWKLKFGHKAKFLFRL